MTGFGEAQVQNEGLTISVELRSVNHRYLKVSVRSGEGYGSIEPQIEKLVRNVVRRGTVYVNLRIQREQSPNDFAVNTDVLDAYQAKLQAWCETVGREERVPIESLLSLPGVVSDKSKNSVDLEEDWPPVEQALNVALESFNTMREEEGQAMKVDFEENLAAIAKHLAEIEKLAPLVVEAYSKRLKERLDSILDQYNLQVEPADFLKEVALYAERGDIAEEVVRLKSHLEQFSQVMDFKESSGRKLEFLTQEMFRETNTIGSKSNDIEIARHVIEIKSAVERMREMVQNVE
jgi:uncharacterized protein (TIGR00255 family)